MCKNSANHAEDFDAKDVVWLMFANAKSLVYVCVCVCVLRVHSFYIKISRVTEGI